jgi:DNA-cytosine methyltransferase
MAKTVAKAVAKAVAKSVAKYVRRTKFFKPTKSNVKPPDLRNRIVGIRQPNGALVFPARAFKLQMVRPTKVLTVGSDCSGLASECMAMMKLGCNHFKHVFACDVCPNSKTFINQNFKPQFWYDNVMGSARERGPPPVDVYVAGFPCQSFSAAGKNKGRADSRGRIVDYIIRYIATKRPTVFVLENVKNLLSKTHIDTFRAILSALNGILNADMRPAYNVRFQVFDSSDFGVPQKRERVYILGRRTDKMTGRRDAHPIDALKCQKPSLRKFLNLPVADKRLSKDALLRDAHGAAAVRNLKMAFAKMDCMGLQLTDDVVVDVASGQGLNMMVDMCPTITKSRGQGRGFFLTSVGKRLTASELARLQGFEPRMYNWQGISRSAAGALIGNSMTVPVLAAVIRKGLLTTGLATHDWSAPWSSFP